MPIAIMDTDYQVRGGRSSHRRFHIRDQIAKAVATERERCASIVENALRDDFKRKDGAWPRTVEAEVFFLSAYPCRYNGDG